MAVLVGLGTSLKFTISSTLTAVAQVMSIDGPNVEAATTETTNLSDVVRKFRAQLPDPGEITFTIEYDPADTGHTALFTAVMSFPQTAVACELDFAGTGTHKWAFNGLVTRFGLKGMNVDDNLEADVTIKVTGNITPT
ncbi:unnamed protein product [uncultured bacterium]|nr:unnamed protein product [uncultured bacterium]